MFFFMSLIPATFFLTLGWFVLFASSKAEGNTQKFGKFLGIWILILALLPLLGGLYVTVTGTCPVCGDSCPMLQMMESGS